MYVKVIDNEIDVGPQSSPGDGDGWYRYEGVSPLDAALNEKIEVSIDGEVATGAFVVDPNITDVADDYVRAIRNDLLKASDWTQIPDSPLGDAKKAEWSTYRQLLRDVPGQPGFPDEITWPDEPS
jgi:hypothetical protein